jgi:hypothetical protein
LLKSSISPQKADWQDRGSAGHTICKIEKIEQGFGPFSKKVVFLQSSFISTAGAV